jgi:hypothetical protein
MAFQGLFDNPLFGDHCPLVLRWSDDQLKPLVERLAPLLPNKLTDDMQLAIASIARSIVTEEKLSGRGTMPGRKTPTANQSDTGTAIRGSPGTT